jgi:hypothetical protein
MTPDRHARCGHRCSVQLFTDMAGIDLGPRGHSGRNLFPGFG